MNLSTTELFKAKNAVNSLLDELGLQSYLFDVEPRDQQWQVNIECAAPDGAWQSIHMEIDKELLTNSHEPDSRSKLIEKWRGRINDCFKS